MKHLSSRTSDGNLLFAVTGDRVEQQGMSVLFNCLNRKGEKVLQGRKSLQDSLQQLQTGSFGGHDNP